MLAVIPGPRPHQAGARPDHRQIGLRLCAAMLHRTQQLGIDPRQPRQGLRIQPKDIPLMFGNFRKNRSTMKDVACAHPPLFYED